MSQRLAAAVLLALAGTCNAQEPPSLPQSPETNALPAIPVESRPALPTFDKQPADSATSPAQPMPAPHVVTDRAARQWRGPLVPADAGVWYRPEAVLPGLNAGPHIRYPYYSYRRPWHPAGPPSLNVTIIW